MLLFGSVSEAKGLGRHSLDELQNRVDDSRWWGAPASLRQAVNCFWRSGPPGKQRDVGFCEGFRMPAADGGRGKHGRPASENLQWRKSREGIRRQRGVRYRELSGGLNPGFSR